MYIAALVWNIKRTLDNQGLRVRETGLEELGKRPYRTLSSLFVKNLFPYETSLYIPSRSDAYHLNLYSLWLGHRLGHNPRIRLLRYAVSMFSPIHKPTLKGEQNHDIG